MLSRKSLEKFDGMNLSLEKTLRFLATNVPPDNVQCISFLLHNFLCGRRTKSPQKSNPQRHLSLLPVSPESLLPHAAWLCMAAKYENLDFSSHLVGSTDSHNPPYQREYITLYKSSPTNAGFGVSVNLKVHVWHGPAAGAYF